MADQPDTAQPLGDQPRGRRTAVLVAVSVAVVAVLGGGAWAAAYILGGHGPQPEEVLPTATLAEISVDMDPSASQKVAAYRTLRKFPALDKKLGAGDDDPRRVLFDQLVKGTGCSSVDFDTQVKPWLGERAALAAVDLQGKSPAPALAVQVSDQQQARAGIKRLVDCGHPGSDFGYAFSDGYVIISDSTDHARTIATAGRQAPLSGDAAFTSAEDQVGDRGVVNFYVAKQAAGYLSGHLAQLTGSGVPAADLGAVKKQASHFQGLSGTVRFADGGLELSAVSRTDKPAPSASKVGAAVADLPGDTAVAIGFAVPGKSIDTLFDSVAQGTGEDPSQLRAQTETMTGLRLPDDLQTLLGGGLTLSLGGDAPDLAQVSGPSDVPFGATVLGDPGKIEDVLSRVEQRQGVTLQQLGVAEKSAAGKVVLASSDGYARKLAAPGDLGGTALFQQVVPGAAKSSGIEFVNFDSRWLDAILTEAGRTEDPAKVAQVRQNLEPLKAFGASSWVDGDTAHFLVKLTTD